MKTSKDKKEKKPVVTDNKHYIDVVSKLNFDSVYYNGEQHKLDYGAKYYKVKMQFKMAQTSEAPQQFNNNFNNEQKIDENGNIVISQECYLRRLFGKNNLLTKNLKEFASKSIHFRGGIFASTDDGNGSWTRALNCDIKSNQYTKVSNDKLGVKAGENIKNYLGELGVKAGENIKNYLGEEFLYKDVVFNATINFYLDSYIKNIMGHPFAQENLLKITEVENDNEVVDFVNKTIPMKGDYLDLDALILQIKTVISDNLSLFSHKGKYPEFAISDFTQELSTSKVQLSTLKA